jgi:hypothetical protein
MRWSGFAIVATVCPAWTEGGYGVGMWTPGPGSSRPDVGTIWSLWEAVRGRRGSDGGRRRSGDDGCGQRVLGCVVALVAVLVIIALVALVVYLLGGPQFPQIP